MRINIKQIPGKWEHDVWAQSVNFLIALLSLLLQKITSDERYFFSYITFIFGHLTNICRNEKFKWICLNYLMVLRPQVAFLAIGMQM